MPVSNNNRSYFVNVPSTLMMLDERYRALAAPNLLIFLKDLVSTFVIAACSMNARAFPFQLTVFSS
jgi:hypothetical protein